MEVPKEIIKEIAEDLESGMKCFIHQDTLEVVTYPDPDRHGGEEIEGFKEEIKKVKKEKKKFIEIENMESRDSFRMMAEFAESVEDPIIQTKLITALEGHKPFANFKIQVDHSGEYRQKWFAFKTQKYIEWVPEQLSLERL